jgi:hypothetical protein
VLRRLLDHVGVHGGGHRLLAPHLRMCRRPVGQAAGHQPDGQRRHERGAGVVGGDHARQVGTAAPQRPPQRRREQDEREQVHGTGEHHAREQVLGRAVVRRE